MSETLTLVKELNIDEFNYYIEQIINSPVDFCRGDIDKAFYSNVLNNCDLLIVNIVNKGIKGFACVNFIDGDEEKGLYIDLICNVDYHSMKTRQDYERLKGRDMINSIINYGISNGYKYVSLSAIESVITYYWYLGFRFDDRSPINEKAQQRLNELLAILRNKSASEEEKELAANEVFKKYSGDFYNENKQSMSKLSIKQRVDVVKDDGILMVKYLNGQSGGKRLKRKTKKAKNKKKVKKSRKKKLKTRRRKSLKRRKTKRL